MSTWIMKHGVKLCDSPFVRYVTKQGVAGIVLSLAEKVARGQALAGTWRGSNALLPLIVASC